ncbi:MAG: alpha/beta hydrolase [Terracidiphilus sp.]
MAHRVVLVHGLGGRAEDWWNVAPVLAKAGFRVYMPDLLGFGRSQQPADFSYSVRDQAAMIVSFMDALGIKQVELAGWSMGGWIVQLVAAEHPERISRLIIIDSVGLNIRPTWNTDLFVPTSPEQLDQLDALLMPNPPAIPPFIARDYLRIFSRNGWVIKRALATMKTGQDVTDSLLPPTEDAGPHCLGLAGPDCPRQSGPDHAQSHPAIAASRDSRLRHMVPLQCAMEMDPAALRFIQ